MPSCRRGALGPWWLSWGCCVCPPQPCFHSLAAPASQTLSPAPSALSCLSLEDPRSDICPRHVQRALGWSSSSEPAFPLGGFPGGAASHEHLCAVPERCPSLWGFQALFGRADSVSVSPAGSVPALAAARARGTKPGPRVPPLLLRGQRR